MNAAQFWTSQDGQILTVRNKDDRTVTLTLGFWPRHPAEFDFLKQNLAALQFTAEQVRAAAASRFRVSRSSISCDTAATSPSTTSGSGSGPGWTRSPTTTATSR